MPVSDHTENKSDDEKSSDNRLTESKSGNKNYLIVDDDTTIQNILSTLFHDLGEVTLATNGKEALEKIEKNPFDLIISDVNMPIMDGLEFSRQLFKNHPEFSNKFLFCTGNPDVELFDICSHYNVPYCMKPLNIREILSSAEKILHK